MSTESIRNEKTSDPPGGPLFVIGMWRSGTSLLYALLNKHPQIALLYEGDLFLLRPLFWISRSGSSRLARWDLRSSTLERHGIDAARIPLGVSGLRTAMERAYQEYARRKGALIWGEKAPLYYDSVTRLAQEFPDARFIIIWRDLEAICGSVIRQANQDSFFGQRGIVHRTLMGYKALKVQCDLLVSRGVPVHQIQYETLVKDPASVMADVCAFVGVPFVPSMVSLEGANRSAIPELASHAWVKGERIVSSLKRPEVVPKDLKNKIERYVSLWAEESGGSWPPSVNSQNQDHHAKPALLERVLDRFAYSYFRSLDSMKLVIWCFAPLRFLRARQAFKKQRWAAATGAKERQTAGKAQ